MSVWKRLANVAKGTVKQWQRDDEDPRRAALERELSELERHPAPGEETVRRRRVEGPAAPRRNPAEEPVQRTDLFGEDAEEGDDASSGDSPPKKDPDGVREGADGRKL